MHFSCQNGSCQTYPRCWATMVKIDEHTRKNADRWHGRLIGWGDQVTSQPRQKVLLTPWAGFVFSIAAQESSVSVAGSSELQWESSAWVCCGRRALFRVSCSCGGLAWQVSWEGRKETCHHAWQESRLSYLFVAYVLEHLRNIPSRGYDAPAIMTLVRNCACCSQQVFLFLPFSL